MQTKHKITSTTIFRLAIISSTLLFFSIMYGQRLFSELWIMILLIELPIILFFIVTFVTGLIFWIKKRKEYNKPYFPLLINILFLGLILILPLNKIRNRIEFASNKTRFEEAVDLVLSQQVGQTTHPEIFRLPKKYQSLSVGGGDVLVIKENSQEGVFFYTFRGVPDGRIGFLKIKGNSNIEDMTENLFIEIQEIKNIGDNWYFISGD